MKIRNGFVSNSSSSSFVILGCELDYDDTEAQKDILTKLEVEFDCKDADSISDKFYNLETDSGISVLTDDCRCFIGKVIADVHDDSSIEESELDIEELSKTIDKLKEILVSKHSIKLYAGTRAC